MFVAYTEKYNQETIEFCMQRQLYDAPVWYDRDYLTLEEKNGNYYIYMSVPAKATGPSRYRRTYRLYFREKGIRVLERPSFFSVLLFLFFIPMMCVCGVGMLLTGEVLMGIVCLGILALCIWLFGFRHKRNVKDFLNQKMQI